MNLTDNKYIDFLAIAPRTITEKITNLLTENNFVVSERWVSLLLFFVSILIIFIIGKVVSNKYLKWVLILIFLILLLGLILPW